jgi:hypothetical protein
MGSSTLDVAAFAGSLSTDVLVVGGLLIVLTLFSLYAGSSQAIAAGLAALFSPPLFIAAQKAVFLSGLSFGTQSFERGMLLVLFVVLTLLFRIMSRDILHMTSPLQAILAAIGATCLIVLVWISTPALASWFPFGTVTALFQESFTFWWIIGIFALFSFARL